MAEFWVQEVRLWDSALTIDEMEAHSAHFESYGRNTSYDNKYLQLHWRLGEGSAADALGNVSPIVDSTVRHADGTGSGFAPSQVPYKKFLEDYAYIPSIDYGNAEKVRTYDGSKIDPQERYDDERTVSLEFNMYDALNEDISHLMTSYEELGNFLGLPVNRYRDEYEGLQQMRETYFKRLQGQLNFGTFVKMLDFFDTTFMTMIEKVIPARASFKGVELVVENHMLERPKYQYQVRPIRDGVIDISGSIGVVDQYRDDF